MYPYPAQQQQNLLHRKIQNVGNTQLTGYGGRLAIFRTHRLCFQYTSNRFGEGMFFFLSNNNSYISQKPMNLYNYYCQNIHILFSLIKINLYHLNELRNLEMGQSDISGIFARNQLCVENCHCIFCNDKKKVSDMRSLQDREEIDTPETAGIIFKHY
jgi:hypothetical protein